MDTVIKEGRGEAGFSLLELVIAIGIILVLTAGGLIGYGALKDNARDAAVESAASMVATKAVVNEDGHNGSETAEDAADEFNKSAKAESVKTEIIRMANTCVKVRATFTGFDNAAERNVKNCSPDDLLNGGEDSGVIPGGDNNGEDGSDGSDNGENGSDESLSKTFTQRARVEVRPDGPGTSQGRGDYQIVLKDSDGNVMEEDDSWQFVVYEKDNVKGSIAIGQWKAKELHVFVSGSDLPDTKVVIKASHYTVTNDTSSSQTLDAGTFTVKADGSVVHTPVEPVEPAPPVDENPDSGDPAKAPHVEYKVEVLINGKSAAGHNTGYYEFHCQNLEEEMCDMGDIDSDGKIILTYSDSGWDIDLAYRDTLMVNIDGVGSKSFSLTKRTLTKVGPAPGRRGDVAFFDVEPVNLVPKNPPKEDPDAWKNEVGFGMWFYVEQASHAAGEGVVVKVESAGKLIDEGKGYHLQLGDSKPAPSSPNDRFAPYKEYLVTMKYPNGSQIRFTANTEDFTKQLDAGGADSDRMTYQGHKYKVKADGEVWRESISECSERDYYTKPDLCFKSYKIQTW